MNVIRVDKPEFRVLLIVSVVKIEDLFAYYVVISINLYNYAVILTELSCGKISVTQSTRMIHIFDDDHTIVQPRVLFQIY